MRRRQPLGLDELMIVNPGPTGTDTLLLGQDGTLYRVQGLGQEGEERAEPGAFFLGEDGSLYQVQGLAEEGSRYLGRFLLGEDGTLYQVVR